jgi:hypothetical protein
MYIDALIAMSYVCNAAAQSCMAGQPAAGQQALRAAGYWCKRGDGVNGVVALGTMADPHPSPTPLVATVPHLRLLRSIPFKRFLAPHPLVLQTQHPRGIYKNLNKDTNVLISVYTTCERSQICLNFTHEQAEGTGIHQEPHQESWCVA